MAEYSSSKLIITDTYQEMGIEAAKIVAEEIRKKPNLVLGLPTGSTPISMYKELIHMHAKEGLDFSEVITFNLDEYYPIQKSNPLSYHYYMKFWLFDYVNIEPENINMLDGETPESNVDEYCLKYEEKIKKIGGIDLLVLGIGTYSGYKDGELIGGHIAFNESGSDPTSRTRKIKLSSKTRLDNSKFFDSLNEVPKYALTMGIATILGAKKILLLASGEHKAEIMKSMIDGGVTEKIPASYLKYHNDLTIIIDKSAASYLEQYKKPWLTAGIKGINWNDPRILEQAIIWLSKKINKSIVQLNEKDFSDNGLKDLVKNFEGVPKIIEEASIQLKNKILDVNNCPKNKKILVISPHPDDDVICLGATMHLFKKFNDVRILYATSGSKSVKDEDLFDFFKNDPNIIELLEKKLSPDIALSEVEIKKIDELRKILREEEAKRAVQVLGIEEDKLTFLNSPFYYKRLFIDGKVRKSEIEDDDINGMVEKLNNIRPDIVIINGERRDPHGTHGKIYQMFEAALRKLSGFKFEVWYYKGAWDEFPLNEVDKLYCFDKYLMDLKIRSIKNHKSQIDALYFGEDQRAFWKRALERNENTGKQLKNLGIIDKELYCEAFKLKIFN
ncbi:MAG: glucosamine-6-phosphate deaminase [Candidatus Lokiarchaeota archaeon]|nr:glucosamine-6-phosphate deaminase [Candidatus Lokiarchaeota archaeon]